MMLNLASSVRLSPDTASVWLRSTSRNTSEDSEAAVAARSFVAGGSKMFLVAGGSVTA